MKDNDKKFTLPMLESPRTLRVKFRKVGNLQYNLKTKIESLEARLATLEA